LLLSSRHRHVDYFVIPAHNLTLDEHKNVTYHHSRLMGVADVQNAVSLARGLKEALSQRR
jgi:hypothetical protein